MQQVLDGVAMPSASASLRDDAHGHDMMSYCECIYLPAM